jgi:hypothetical protein
MDELHSILIKHHAKAKKPEGDESPASHSKAPTTSEIPDIFFDDILRKFKLTRLEIQVLMYFYRLVWCKPNLHAKYGLTDLISYAEVSKNIGISSEELINSIQHLESYGFMQTVRAGQYMVHKYFTKEYDQIYNQNYDEF